MTLDLQSQVAVAESCKAVGDLNVARNFLSGQIFFLCIFYSLGGEDDILDIVESHQFIGKHEF